MQAADDLSPKTKIQEYAKKSLYSSLCTRLHAFYQGKDGIAAIEFAYIMPFMAIMWIGMSVGSEVVNANRKVSLLAYSIGDMTSQVNQINQENLDTIFLASASILWPFESSAISLRVTSYWFNNDGKSYIRWSAVPSNKNLSGEYKIKEKCEKVESINSNLTIKNSEIFLIEAKVTYTASIGGAIANQIYGDTFTNGQSQIFEYAYVRPRVINVPSTLPTLCKTDPYAKK